MATARRQREIKQGNQRVVDVVYSTKEEDRGGWKAQQVPAERHNYGRYSSSA